MFLQKKQGVLAENTVFLQDPTFSLDLGESLVYVTKVSTCNHIIKKQTRPTITPPGGENVRVQTPPDRIAIVGA